MTSSISMTPHPPTPNSLHSPNRTNPLPLPKPTIIMRITRRSMRSSRNLRVPPRSRRKARNSKTTMTRKFPNPPSADSPQSTNCRLPRRNSLSRSLPSQSNRRRMRNNSTSPLMTINQKQFLNLSRKLSRRKSLRNRKSRMSSNSMNMVRILRKWMKSHSNSYLKNHKPLPTWNQRKRPSKSLRS